MVHRPTNDELYEDDDETAPARTSPAVIEAHSAFRLLLVLVTIWSFIEGFALFTGSIDALSLNADRVAERIVGAQMLVLSGAFALLAWRREQFRLLLWLPYAAQIAIIIPIGISIFGGSSDGALLFVVSLIFFVLLFYFWYHSHPLEHFQEALDEDDQEDAEDVDGWPQERGAPPTQGPARGAAPSAPVSDREPPRRSSKFRRRDP